MANKRDIDVAKEKINILHYIKEVTRIEPRKSGKLWRFFPCPKCESKSKPGHFVVSEETQTFSSLNQCCKAGDVLRFMTEVEGLSNSEANKKLFQMSGEERSSIQLIKVKKEDFNIFYHKLTEQYKYWKNQKEIEKNKSFKDKSEKRILLCELNEGFYDEITNIFVEKDHFTDNEVLKNIKDTIRKRHKENVNDVFVKLSKFL